MLFCQMMPNILFSRIMWLSTNNTESKIISKHWNLSVHFYVVNFFKTLKALQMVYLFNFIYQEKKCKQFSICISIKNDTNETVIKMSIYLSSYVLKDTGSVRFNIILYPCNSSRIPIVWIFKDISLKNGVFGTLHLKLVAFKCSLQFKKKINLDILLWEEITSYKFRSETKKRKKNILIVNWDKSWQFLSNSADKKGN